MKLGRSVVILAALSAYACGGPPSRGDTASLIRPVVAQKIRTSKITLGYFTSDREGRVAFNESHFCDWRKAMETAKALTSSGHLDAPVLRRERSSGWMCGSKRVYEWFTGMLLGGEQCCFRNVATESEQLPTAEAIVAKAELVEVTGVTAPTEGLPPGPMVTAEFTYRWVPTPIGTILAEHEHKLPSTDIQSGKATFVRYDDGWRLEDLDL